MAIGWLTALKLIPWTDVISNAPVVVDGAKKLWNNVGKKPAPGQSPPATSTTTGGAVATPDARALAELRERVATLEAAVADLHGQMVTSSELLKTLAEQNAQMIARVQTNRVRTLWLGAIAVAAAVAALVLALAGGGG